jgi:Ca2+-transporting ATPase
MSTAAHPGLENPDADERWYSLSVEDICRRFGVDPESGLTASQAASLFESQGANALPLEEAVAGWRRFLAQYTSYMQVILLAAAVVSLAVQQWSTGVLLIAITMLNAVVGRGRR